MSIIVKNLSKQYNSVLAVDNISFSIYPGEIVGLLGPNGAGKTTTVRLILGYLAPTNGSIEVFGKDVRQFPFEVRRLIGYLPEENPLYFDMDVIDFLTFVAELQDVPKNNIPTQVKKVIDAFGLNGVQHIDIGKLSKGFRQRVGLAGAMIHDPKILILDEPTNGLDPNQTKEFRDFLTRIGKSKTIILSTHALTEVQSTCNRVIIIGKGRILLDAVMSDLEKKFVGQQMFYVEIERGENCTGETVIKKLKEIKDVVEVAQLDDQEQQHNVLKFYIEARKDVDVRKDIYHTCAMNHWQVLDLHRQKALIEDIFHQITVGK